MAAIEATIKKTAAIRRLFMNAEHTFSA